jgi:hypothetical protein
MNAAASSHSIRVRGCRESIHEGRTFHLAAGIDVRAALQRTALAAVPKAQGWTLLAFTIERTQPGEHVAAVLDHLSRREMGAPDFAAGVAATLDGAYAVLAVAAKDTACVERMRSALSSAVG